MTTTTVLMNVALCASDGGTFYNSNGSKIAIRYFQLELPDYNDDRACYPSSYTTGNRGDDYAQFDNMTWYDQGLNTGNFSWYTEWRHITDSSSIYPWWLGTADPSARMTTGLFSAVAQTTRFWCLNNPGNDGLSESNGTLQTDYTTNYACGSLQTNNQKHCLNAGSIGGDITVDYPMSDTVTQAASYVGCGSTTSAIGGHMRALVFVDDFWDDSTLTDYATNGYTFSTTFPGNIAGDGGHVWPARANDPRWTQIISDSGITASGNFQDDVRVLQNRGYTNELF
jgi:hypothetical protein